MPIDDAPKFSEIKSKFLLEFTKQRDILLENAGKFQTLVRSAIKSKNFEPAQSHLNDLIINLGKLKTKHRELNIQPDPKARTKANSLTLPPEMFENDSIIITGIFQIELAYAVMSGDFIPVEQILEKAKTKLQALIEKSEIQ